MGRGRRKKVIIPKIGDEENNYFLRDRRSSMKVNLSFVSDLSDCTHESLKQMNDECEKNSLMKSFLENNDLLKSLSKSKSKKSCINNDISTPLSVSNITVINVDDHFCFNKTSLYNKTPSNSLIVMNEKEQQLNKSCMQLKDAIMFKTQELFDKENELSIKTTEVLSAGSNSVLDNFNENQSNETNEKRSPSIRVDIGKNDQIIMSGDGRKTNPVQINFMSNHDSAEINCKVSSQSRDELYVDCNQSIVSTPKKLRIESCTNEKDAYNKDSETILRIPVVRLFADTNDPNNSMSELNPIININSLKKIDINDQQADTNSISDESNVSIELNYSTSPILSQGTRKSRISCLSLKKKLKKSSIQTSLKLLHNTINESFANRVPLTCSSFLEKDGQDTNINEASKNVEINNLYKKDIVSICSKTIDLDNSQPNDKTIDIDSSKNQSSMELTTISSHMPIKYRSFQKNIRRSLKLDNMIITQQGIQNINILEGNPINEHRIHDINQKHDLISKNTVPNNQDCQNNYSTNAVNTSVNQSTSHTNLDNFVLQKENKKPNIIDVTSNADNVKEIAEDNVMILQRLSSCSIRSSMQVNTSLDSIRKSIIPNNIPCKKLNSDKLISQQEYVYHKKYDNRIMRLSRNSINKVKKNNIKITSQQPSTYTIRSSMHVNTSLDSAQKSPITEHLINFNNMLSMVEENITNHDQHKTITHRLTSQSSDSEYNLDNVSLIDRIKNIYRIKENKRCNKPNQTIVNRINKSVVVENPNLTLIDKAVGTENISIDSKDQCNKTTKHNLIPVRKSMRLKYLNETERLRNKSTVIENTSSTANDLSVIEGTPYPISRSVLMKTMLKNKIARNTLDPKTFINSLDNKDLIDESETLIQKDKKNGCPERYQNIINRKQKLTSTLLDTIVLDSSDELSNKIDKEKDPVIIDESLNDTEIFHKTKADKKINYKQKNKKIVAKRKLYPLRQNSQLISFSPADIQDSPKVIEQTKNKKKRKTRIMQQRKQKKKKTNDDVTLDEIDKLLEKDIAIENVEKPKKKARKIISKKIIVKKITNLSILEKMMNNDQSTSKRLSNRSSSKEFDLRNVTLHRKGNSQKSQKNIIVVTGLTKEDKDLVKSVIKSLGSASLEMNVTPRTTHVISSGLRTINLLKGIIRGCWLLTLDWALQSLESGKWLDPSPFEMSHFAKAVQENRRDRKLFGKAYVPDIFVTCGLIYIQNGTSPPAPILKELIKIAGGRITENSDQAAIIIGKEGLKEIWVLDSITTGEVQPVNEYKRKNK